MPTFGVTPAHLGLAAVLAVCALGSEARAHDEPLTSQRPVNAARVQQLGESAPRGQMAITYQNQKAQDLATSHATNRTGAIHTQTLDFAASYRIRDRWTINAGLPLIAREALTPSHNPLNIIPQQLDSRFVDDGHYHGYFQDLRLGASYLVTSEPIAFETYLEYGIPVSDYPFFAASAIGRQLQTLEVGTTLAYRPPFLQWYFSLQAGYQMADKVLGYSTNGTRVTADAVYFIKPRLALNTFFTSKNSKGFAPPAGPIDPTSELWYRHDQITRHNYQNVGVGIDWTLGDRNALNFTLLKMVHAEDVFKLRRAVSVSLTRAF